MKSIFGDYGKQEKDIKKYGGVEYVAYDKEYTDEALDNDEYDKKNDEIISTNAYTQDEPECLQIDRRSITNYYDTLIL
jgi:hypothetical protein